MKRAISHFFYKEIILHVLTEGQEILRENKTKPKAKIAIENFKYPSSDWTKLETNVVLHLRFFFFFGGSYSPYTIYLLLKGVLFLKNKTQLIQYIGYGHEPFFFFLKKLHVPTAKPRLRLEISNTLSEI